MRLATKRFGLCLVSATLGCVVVTASAAEQTGSLCKASEMTYFSCSTGTKLVSLCASARMTDSTAVLQYRFGKRSGEVELAYPSDASKPQEVFKAYTYSFAKGGVSAIGFKIGKFSYSLFETRSVYGYNGAGVTVSKNGGEPKIIECVSLPSSPSEFYYELGEWKLSEDASLHFIGPEQ
jgi:hypothetical protein